MGDLSGEYTDSGPASEAGGEAADPSSAGWQAVQSAELYRIDSWGEGFFNISDSGHVTVAPDHGSDSAIDLYEVVCGLKERGIDTPVIVGFPHLVKRRMQDIAAAFTAAIEEKGYRSGYNGVYPIKVNQHRYLVKEVDEFGRDLGFGLEVGSKPELLAVMGLTADDGDRLIVCNGFKEERYIRHILLATKLGRRIVVVVENFDELDLIIQQSIKEGVRPRIGVRLKIDARSSGRWLDSTGEKAKFGLTIPGILEVVTRLKEAGMLDCLELLHCHMGSQIGDIQVINAGLAEVTRVYVELKRLGAAMLYLDVGGGLGIDYDGSKTNSDFSVNYSLEEYAGTVVYRIMAVCDEAGVDHPTIVTEAGRAMVGHHSVLVFNVLGCNRMDRWTLDIESARAAVEAEGAPRILVDLLDAFESVSDDNLLEAYHDAIQAREEALIHFNVGLLGLARRGLADRIFWSTCVEVGRRAQELDPMPEELDELELRLSDTYFCNLSVFQSLPDSWAIDQVFPIVPIHRLDEEPRRRTTLVDITCDSDGKINRFIDPVEDVALVLPVHELEHGKPYFLAVFLVGAYQETLGDFHNLFGDTNLVHIRSYPNGTWGIEEVVVGDSVSEVLSYLEYDPRELSQAIRRDCERAVRADRLSVAESRAILEAYDEGLKGSTYLE
jgi:arginine decarboxylase